MDLGLQNKVVVVTGGAKGIGAAISEAFAQEGAKLVVNYRSDAPLCEEFIARLRADYGVEAIGVQGDVGNIQTVNQIFAAALETYGRLDILINNAGGGKTTALVDITLEEWNDAMQGNVTGMMMMSREFARILIGKKQPGKIINILSKVAMSTKSKGRTCYVVNKTAELGLTRQLAVELTEHGIIVNGILPGLIKTAINADNPNFADKEARQILKRACTPDELASTVAYVASDKATTLVGSMVDCTAGALLGF
ncbi:SDR family oxidoreductase [Eubacteriales bacterium OttesenSCG-928-N14]|nr:SDR family oxidoreductase [Eubacteriales bacterium OttesenSCG-928-N14]